MPVLSKQRAMIRAGAIARQATPAKAAAVAGAGFKQGPKLPPNADLAQVAEARGIEAFLVSFVDIMGTLRSKMVPAAAIRQIQKDGAGFAPFAAWLDYGPDAADLIVIPDTTTLLQVPFQPELAFVIGDCYIDGERVMDSPRWVLKDQIEKAAKLGYTLKTGVEPEFFLLSPAGEGEEGPISISDVKDKQMKPCYDTQALMRRFNVLQEIVTSLNACGFGVYQTDHEDGNGQFEINWKFGDCLQTADQHVFFKWLTKTCAERHGFRATFMDRPFKELTGSGCHVHASLWAGEKNVFEGVENAGPQGTVAGLGLSDVGLRFMQGVLQKCQSFCAITNPTVNSYKRLNGAETTSGATWSPNRISFSGNNRTHLVRVPKGDRFELRVAGGAVNPYLLQAAVLASGLWGLCQKGLDVEASFINPQVNMYTLPAGSPVLEKIGRLPENLLDALRLLEKDRGFAEALGCRFVEAFLKLKKAEWTSFSQHLSSWELENSLDC